ncbi:hypothetical protein C8Q76DRAFT_751022 [Earliella scabrosa]|nr:hypothetical protein C8Q76DRAFT_751022 [Earliella scabrosa]
MSRLVLFSAQVSAGLALQRQISLERVEIPLLVSLFLARLVRSGLWLLVDVMSFSRRCCHPRCGRSDATHRSARSRTPEAFRRWNPARTSSDRARLPTLLDTSTYTASAVDQRTSVLSPSGHRSTAVVAGSAPLFGTYPTFARAARGYGPRSVSPLLVTAYACRPPPVEHNESPTTSNGRGRARRVSRQECRSERGYEGPCLPARRRGCLQYQPGCAQSGSQVQPRQSTQTVSHVCDAHRYPRRRSERPAGRSRYAEPPTASWARGWSVPS